VGLCEYVQRIALSDYICVSASLETAYPNRSTTCTEHLVDPIVIRNGRCMFAQLSGYSIEMHAGSFDPFHFP
jgi:L-fuconate dehydratase